MSNKTVVFHHIPKTAGTTFYSILKKQYAELERFHIDGLNPAVSLESFKKLDSRTRDNYKLVFGHLADKFIPFIQNELVYIVFLRDPIDHFLSSFYYIQRAESNRFYKEVKKMTLENFIEMRLEKNLDNLQTRHLSGDTDFLLDANREPADFKTLGEYFYLKAMNKLESVNFILFTEYFDESIITLKNSLIWKSKPYYKIRNKTNDRPLLESFSQETLTKVKNACYWDIKLYDYAKQHFLGKIITTDIEFRRDVNRFKLMNRYYNIFSL